LNLQVLREHYRASIRSP